MYKNALNFLVFFLISLFFVAGCSKNEDEKTAEKKIALPEELVEKRWDALISKDWEKAYNFETPSYRLASTVEDYENSFGTAITWISAKTISSKEVSEKVIDVNVPSGIFKESN